MKNFNFKSQNISLQKPFKHLQIHNKGQIYLLFPKNVPKPLIGRGGRSINGHGGDLAADASLVGLPFLQNLPGNRLVDFLLVIGFRGGSACLFISHFAYCSVQPIQVWSMYKSTSSQFWIYFDIILNLGVNRPCWFQKCHFFVLL